LLVPTLCEASVVVASVSYGAGTGTDVRRVMLCVCVCVRVCVCPAAIVTVESPRFPTVWSKDTLLYVLVWLLSVRRCVLVTMLWRLYQREIFEVDSPVSVGRGADGDQGHGHLQR
jgi:hypothetical protein